MSLISVVLLISLMVGVLVWWYSRRLAKSLGGVRNLPSLPLHFAIYSALWCMLPALALILVWLAFGKTISEWMVSAELAALGLERGDDQTRLILNAAWRVLQTDGGADGAVLTLAQQLQASQAMLEDYRNIALLVLLVGAVIWALSRLRARANVRRGIERLTMTFIYLCATVAVLCTLGILFSVLFEALRFFALVSPYEFLFGFHWSPQTALRADQVGSSGSFGVIPLLVGTGLISAIAMSVAVPVGLLSAIYLSEYADSRARKYIKPVLEMLAGIPTVVYGFFAALTVAPLIRNLGEDIGLTVSSQSALAAGLVMGVMTIPFVSSLSDDIIHAVPNSLREGALALGAMPSEMIRQVVLPAALPGVVGSILLAVSRAIGETMIVVMAAGLIAQLTLNPLDSVTTITVQIVTLLVGDQAFDSAKTLSAFALGLLLFIVTLILNIIALVVVRRYRERYE